MRPLLIEFSIGDDLDRSTKFAPEQIVPIEVAGPLPHGADLTAVFNFIGQRVSDTRVNFGVQDQDMRRKPFGFCGPAGLERPNRGDACQLGIVS